MPAVSVSSSAEQEIVPVNPNRFELWIKNTGTVDVHLNVSSTANTNHYPLSAGESMVISQERPARAAIRGIAASGTGTIKYSEFTNFV